MSFFLILRRPMAGIMSKTLFVGVQTEKFEIGQVPDFYFGTGNRILDVRIFQSAMTKSGFEIRIAQFQISQLWRAPTVEV
jgi:hypothetical protein